MSSSSSSSYPSFEIPSVDLGPFFEDKGVVVGELPTKDQERVASTINAVCQEHGFVHVTNFGMSSSFGESLVEAAKEVFVDPEEYTPWSPLTNTGFSAYRNESLNTNRPPDLKEAFNIRFPPVWQNPSLPKTPEAFRLLIDEYTSIMKKATIRYGWICALALGLPLDTFTKTLNTFDMCTSRFLHYPPCDFVDETSNKDQSTASVNLAVRVGEHTDFGAYTFLLLSNKQGPMGFQFKPGERGGAIGGSVGGEEDGWMDVTIAPNGDTNNSFGAIINTGAMMARMTNDFWKATPHRVIVPSREIASQHRYSIAFFVDPDSHEMIQVEGKYKDYSPSGDEESLYHEPISSKDFIVMKLKELAQAGKKNT